MRNAKIFSLDEVVRAEADALRLEGSAPIGLALSGGGIRSATFSLGVLQALAENKRLSSFDYLSTVSGGGYIGSWLTAWIHREGFAKVQEKLGGFESRPATDPPATAEPPEVTWLRRYSSYLAPKVGLFSLDSLTLITTWSRNFLLNLLILLSSIAVALLLPYLLVPVVRAVSHHHTAFGFAASWVGLLFLFATAYNLWHQGQRYKQGRNWLISAHGVGATVVVPGVLSACFGALWLFGGPDKTWADAMTGIRNSFGLLAILLVAWLVLDGGRNSQPVRIEPAKPEDGQPEAEPRRQRRRPMVSSGIEEFLVYAMAAMGGLVACAVVLGGCYGLWKVWRPIGEQAKPAGMLTFGPPALLFAFGMGTTVFTGLVGRAYFERSREWWSRLNAWLLTIALVWAVWCGLAFFSLPLLRYASQHIGDWVVSAIGAGWAASLAAAVFARPPQSASQNVQWNIERVLNFAAGIAIAGLLLAIAAGGQWVLMKATDSYMQPPQSLQLGKTVHELRGANGDLAATVSEPASRDVPLSGYIGAHFNGIYGMVDKEVIEGLSTLNIAVFGLFAMMLMLGWRVDINKFSLHNMYKNRLVRCYLGASNTASRNAQPFTGLDDNDDIPLSKLAWTESDGTTRVRRPLHLLNTTLNITQGSNLAWQERKAASFTFSPLHCGYSLARTQGDTRSIEAGDAEPKAYRSTAQYATRDLEENGFKLGMALATSGAAVSPNMGHASQPARAFLLTLFNVRLGRWSSNPGTRKFWRPSPGFGLFLLLQELFGFSNEQRGYVYLSDGGHFDNLGVYELVRRRCKTIFVVDAGADPARRMADVAEMVRKCRVDLGVEIEFPDLPKLTGDAENRPEVSFVKGTIHYGGRGPACTGDIVLIKPTMLRSRSEPADLLHYAAQNGTFPQQATADQFFDESQFESYRRLGLHVARACLEEHKGLLPHVEPQSTFAEVVPIEETPLRATRLVRRVFPLGRDEVELPPPDNSLVDYVAAGVLIVMLLATSFVLVDQMLLGTNGFCLSRQECAAAWQTVLETASNRSVVAYLDYRGWADNIFVAVYGGIFLCSAALAFQNAAPERPVRLLKWLFVAAVLVLVVTDYTENFMLAQGLAKRTDFATLAADLGTPTAIKFNLSGICILGFVLMLPFVAAAFERRWKPERWLGTVVRHCAQLTNWYRRIRIYFKRQFWPGVARRFKADQPNRPRRNVTDGASSNARA